MLTLFPPLISTTYKALCRSCRLEVVGAKHRERVLAAHGKALMAFWHETCALAAYYYRGSGAHTLTSYSYDGELAARVVRGFGLEAVRGSSSRGGLKALVHLARAFEHVDQVGFTLDGPRGPRREAKAGIAILAAKTGVPVVPNAYAVEKEWRMNSWDRFIVPKPFGRIVVAFGAPIEPPSEISEAAVEKTRLEVEEALNRLHEEIENRLAAPKTL
jgi:hypothetical protein